MKTTMKLKILFSMVLLLIISCSKDDDSTPTINATDFSATVDENQAANASLGTISAAGTGALTYSITSQIPNGAMSINSITGELKVANASLFDFETNPNIDAVITILNTEATTTVNATINLNDIDDIEFFLSSSKTAYTNASAGDWVEVTEAEYNNLANSLNDITKVATSDADYNNSMANGASNASFTAANNNGVTMPNNSYVFGFKYNAINSGISANKAKQSSTSISDGYVDLGGNLPVTVAGENYLILKGSNSPTTNTGFLAIYQSDTMGLKSITGSTYNYFNATSNNDSNSIPNSASNAIFLYQGLSTTQKQWN